MTNYDIKAKRYKRTREEVIEESIVDVIPICPVEDLKLVLNDWKKIRPNLKEISVGVSQRFFAENPFYKALFPAFADVSDEDLPYNEDFILHSNAILKGINSIMMNFSAEYEEENEILPAIGLTHMKRGIPVKMMEHLKMCLISECCRFLESKKREKAIWESVMTCIFDNYLLRPYPNSEKRSSVD